MPPEPLPRSECQEPGCRVEFSIERDERPAVARGAFTCFACGQRTPANVRVGEPVERVSCVHCGAVQTEVPARFSIAVIGEERYRLRCEGCGFTWEPDVVAWRCPRCQAEASTQGFIPA
jgi:Zn finger protein HypA/HybF involved in hydrogenase expression